MEKGRDFLFPRRQPRIVEAGGGGGGSGVARGSCVCTCIAEGDITVNDVETTSRWKIAMSDEIFTQEFGSIIFPAGTYVLTYDTGSSTWVLDIGDYLTAEYADGGDATSSTTMDGTLTMGFDSYGVPYVSLCVDGTVPEGP